MGLFGLLKPKPQLALPKFRLVVFAAEEMLPCPLQIVHPDGLGNALLGEAAVLNGRPNQNLWVEQPMGAGNYQLRGLSADVNVSVEPLSNGGFFTLRDLAGSLDLVSSLEPGERGRLERAQWAVTLDLGMLRESAPEAVLYQMEIADRFSLLAAGLIYDQVSQRCYLPGRWRLVGGLKPLDVREHISLHLEPTSDGTLWVHTHGLAKFCKPELEIRDLPTELGVATCQLIIKLSQRLIGGADLRPGGTALHLGVPLYVRVGSEESSAHLGGQVLELVDAGRNGKPAERGAARGIEFYAGVSQPLAATAR